MNKSFDEALGATLRSVRQQTGLTQVQAAQAIGRTQATVSRWENGSLPLAAADVACVVTAYSTTPDALYSQALQEAPAAIPDEITRRARALEGNHNKRRRRRREP